MENKEYINYAEESLEKLGDSLVEFENQGWQFLIIANHKEGAGGIIGKVHDPDMMKVVSISSPLRSTQV